MWEIDLKCSESDAQKLKVEYRIAIAHTSRLAGARQCVFSVSVSPISKWEFIKKSSH